MARNVIAEHLRELDRYILQDADRHTAGCEVHLTLTSKTGLITIRHFWPSRAAYKRSKTRYCAVSQECVLDQSAKERKKKNLIQGLGQSKF